MVQDQCEVSTKTTSTRTSARGQAIILVTLSVPVLFGLMAMVVDVGWGYWRQEACKTVAEAAAGAAAVAAKTASNYTCGNGVACTGSATTYADCPSSPAAPPSDNLQNGCLYAQSNGFTTGGNGGRQRVSYAAYTSNPPVTGSSPTYWVRFVVYDKTPAWFSVVLGSSWTRVSAASTAGVFQGNPGCVYILDPTAPKALTVTGGTFSTGCGVYVNSDATNAFYLTGGTLDLNNGAAINVHGQEYTTGGTVSPNNVNQNTGSVSDPMSGLTVPSSTSPCSAAPVLTAGTLTLYPGTYCSITVKGGALTMQPGTYVIDGIFKNSGGTVDASSGVTLYFAPNPPNSSGLQVTSGNTMVLTAPSTGAYAGLALWQDGTSGSTNSQTFTAGLTINGIIYMPHTKLTYTGGTTPVTQTIIVDTLDLSGGAINQAATSANLTGGIGLTSASIIE